MTEAELDPEELYAGDDLVHEDHEPEDNVEPELLSTPELLDALPGLDELIEAELAREVNG